MHSLFVPFVITCQGKDKLGILPTFPPGFPRLPGVPLTVAGIPGEPGAPGLPCTKRGRKRNDRPFVFVTARVYLSTSSPSMQICFKQI